MTGTLLGGQVSLPWEGTNQDSESPQGLPIENQVLRIFRPALSPRGKSFDSLPSQCEPHILQAVLKDGLPHRQTAFMPLAGLHPLSQNSSLPRGCPLSSPNLPVLRDPGVGAVGVFTSLHSWGRLRAPHKVSADTPAQKHPENDSILPLPS